MNVSGLSVCFDFDSTVVTKESLDRVIERALAASPERECLVREVEVITNASMNGDLSFTESLMRRFSVVPLTHEQFATVGRELVDHITPGFPALFAYLAQNDVPTFIISGGFRPCLLPVAAVLGVPPERVIANELVTDETGKVLGIDTAGPCYTDHGKAPVITALRERFGLTGPVCMIGDGANDLQAYEQGKAEYFCGFTANAARERIVKQAPVTADSAEAVQAYLDTLL